MKRLFGIFSKDRHRSRQTKVESTAAKPNVSPSRKSAIGLPERSAFSAFRTAVDQCGLPIGWLSFSIHRVEVNDGKYSTRFVLSVKHWDPRLLPHLVAFQNRFSDLCLQLDGTMVAQLSEITWKFCIQKDWKIPEMPPASFWGLQAAASAFKEAKDVDFEIPSSSANRVSVIEKLWTQIKDPGIQSKHKIDFQDTVPASMLSTL